MMYYVCTSTGLGDMAVSNTIGSNVFDILVGLGVPWGLQTMAVNYGSVVSVMLSSLTNILTSTHIHRGELGEAEQCWHRNVNVKHCDCKFNFFTFVTGENQQ